jgi:2-polyprenyl-6-methoxyphenol hydroxylase-like FAD-dependent oxidoreductase
VVERTALHAVLSGPVEDLIRCDCPLEAVDGGRVRLADGSSEDGFDVVVAADGLGSTVRAGWPEDPGVRFAGYHAWRGATSAPVRVDGLGELWGRGRRFGIAPLRDGRIYWFATTNGARDAVPPADLDAVRSAFAGWHEDVGRILDAADPDETQCLPIDDLRPGLTTFVRGGTVLLGDAAHAMTPNLGQGANQALEDAAQLTHELAPLVVRDGGVAVGEVERALHKYDRQRRPRAQRVAARARRLGHLGQLDGAFTTTMRNVGLRLVPDRLTDAGARSLQRWDVR